jgi:hypothetical protein
LNERHIPNLAKLKPRNPVKRISRSLVRERGGQELLAPGPRVVESSFIAYNNVSGGSDDTLVVGWKPRGEAAYLLLRLREIPTASPAPSLMRWFAGLSCGRYCPSHRPLIDRRLKYRPLTDRVEICCFAGCFFSAMVTAVGAVDVLQHLWYPIAPHTMLAPFTMDTTYSNIEERLNLDE